MELRKFTRELAKELESPLDHIFLGYPPKVQYKEGQILIEVLDTDKRGKTSFVEYLILPSPNMKEF